MSRFNSHWFKSVSLVALLAVVFCLGRADAPQVNAQNPNASLAQRVAELERLLEHVHRVDGEVNGLAGPHLIFEGCNVHVRNASGDTFEIDGTGNLIVGYNEPPGTRTGSHNLVVGFAHTYTSYGGFVAGLANEVTAPYATVSAGTFNVASGAFASVSGGVINTASGQYASVSGGHQNTASGDQASVTGGFENEATGGASVVSGGFGNVSSGPISTVSGGGFNDASALEAVVVGGQSNTAEGLGSVVVGGEENTASGDFSIAP